MPRLVVLEPDFRIVEDVVSANLVHTLEVRDGVDAMGVEKWRHFRTDSKDLKAIFSYLIRMAVELEAVKREQRDSNLGGTEGDSSQPRRAGQSIPRERKAIRDSIAAITRADRTRQREQAAATAAASELAPAGTSGE